MGTWSASINGNDTAQDLKPEYQAAFFCNDVETALAKIDAYVREDFDERDEEAWSCYFFSLADFMWKHGILTDEVQARAVEMIDSGFGLELWEEQGKPILNQRKKVLASFREKLLSPQPPKKNIRFQLHKPVFQTGDLVALQLNTLDKPCTSRSALVEEAFRSSHGKYIVLRKVCDDVKEYSYLEPQLRDHWAVFQLYKALFSQCPTPEQLQGVPFVPTRDGTTFTSESSMFYYKKRNCQVIGNDQWSLPVFKKNENISFLFWSVNTPWSNPDSDILKVILTDSVLK